MRVRGFLTVLVLDHTPAVGAIPARPASAQIFPPPTPVLVAVGLSRSVARADGAAWNHRDRGGRTQNTMFISQNTNGFGKLGLPEAPNFVNGTSPAAPLSPYDTLSGAPMTPGDTGQAAVYVTPTYHGSFFNASATFGLGYVIGSTTNATYWSEIALYRRSNPHLGSQMLGYGAGGRFRAAARRRQQQRFRRIGVERRYFDIGRKPAGAGRLVRPRPNRRLRVHAARLPERDPIASRFSRRSRPKQRTADG